MSVLQSVKDIIGSFEANPSNSTNDSEGAYWCDSCDVKKLDFEIEGDDITCPECGEEMRFERSMKGAHCC